MNFSFHRFICALDRWSPRNNLTRTKKSGKRGPVPYSYNKAKVILKKTLQISILIFPCTVVTLTHQIWGRWGGEGARLPFSYLKCIYKERENMCYNDITLIYIYNHTHRALYLLSRNTFIIDTREEKLYHVLPSHQYNITNAWAEKHTQTCDLKHQTVAE